MTVSPTATGGGGGGGVRHKMGTDGPGVRGLRVLVGGARGAAADVDEVAA